MLLTTSALKGCSHHAECNCFYFAQQATPGSPPHSHVLRIDESVQQWLGFTEPDFRGTGETQEVGRVFQEPRTGHKQQLTPGQKFTTTTTLFVSPPELCVLSFFTDTVTFSRLQVFLFLHFRHWRILRARRRLGGDFGSNFP